MLSFILNCLDSSLPLPKNSCDDTGLTEIIQDHLFIFVSTD